MQDYFLPDIKIPNEEKKFLFSMQSSMVEIKGNFSKKYKNTDCEAKCGEYENMTHILSCQKLNKGNTSEENIDIEQIFEENLGQKIEVMKTFKNYFDLRYSMIKEERRGNKIIKII